jgi:hypothetical protein
MIFVLLRDIQRNVGKDHVLMAVVADQGVLDSTDGAGDSGLGENQHQGGA